MSEIPRKISPDEYDKLLRRIWELEQRMAGYEKASCNAVDHDMLFDKMRLIERMMIKIGVALVGRKKKS